jgi:hypothetical protein
MGGRRGRGAALVGGASEELVRGVDGGIVGEWEMEEIGEVWVPKHAAPMLRGRFEKKCGDSDSCTK